METSKSPLQPRKVRRPVADEKSLLQALDLIRGAKRPVVLAGNGTIRKRASRQLRLFAQRSGIGVISTFMAKGCVDRDDPHCLFTIGLQAKDYVACAIDAADLVITVGYDMVEYHPKLWNPDGNKAVLHIDFLPAEVDQEYNCDLEVVGDIAHTLWFLNERLAALDAPPFDIRRQAGVRREMLSEFQAHCDDTSRGALKPQKVLWDLRQALGPHDILLSDVGAHKMWIARYYQCNEPNTCLIPNGFCSMGFALPGAIAASHVMPHHRVVAVCGDGGFLMNVQEMETARRLGSRILVMVWEDGGYGLISWKQDNQFGRHTHLSFGNPNFVTLAEAFGWQGVRVEHAADLRPALDKALTLEGPVLMSLPIDYSENHKLSQRLGAIACPI